MHGMQRVVVIAAAVILAPAESVNARAFSCPKPTANYRQLGSAAYIWGYPLIRSAQLRQNMTLPEDPLRARPSSTAGAPLNRLGHARELATAETRQGVAPNNDTLYSVAWLDTDAGPFVFDSPDFGSRYYTYQFGQADTSTDLALGQSTHGARLPPIFIQGPRNKQKVPRGMLEVRSTQRYLMIAGRTLVTGPADLAAAQRLQDAMELRRWADYRDGRQAQPPITNQRLIERRDPPATDASAFLTMLGVVLTDWRSPPAVRAFVHTLAPLGLSEGRGFNPSCLSASQISAVQQGLQEGRTAIEQRTGALGISVNGWTINFQGANFGRDHLLRAAVAMDQIYVLPANEALYINAKRDADGKVLDGNKSYILRFAGNALPPVRHFWSATMYFAKGFLVPNEIKRYSIGDRTPGLARGKDGSIEILLQHARPKDAGAANWLPSPAEPFTVMLRLYGPGDIVAARQWNPPAIVEVNPQ